MRKSSSLIVFTVLFLLTSSGFGIVLSQEQYAVGVKPGDYVKYGNFVLSGPRIAPQHSELGWQKVEVLAISWDNNIPADIITISGTIFYKNGTSYESTSRLIINPGVPIILPANLSQGEDIAARYNVTRTENRTYLGVSRTVNIAEFPRTYGDSTTNATFVFDRASGMKLEELVEMKDPAGTTISSFSVVETNIFGPSPTPTPTLSSSSNIEPSPSIPEFPSFLAFGLIIISTIAGTLLCKRTLSEKQ